MTEENVLDLIKEKFPDIEGSIPEHQKYRVHVKITKNRVKEMARFLKENGFRHLSFITCVDWIDEGEFELVYGISSYDVNIVVLLKTRVPRDNPHQETLLPLWDQAQTYEREIHEMFGVVFDGNPNLTPFILEDWEGIPPMRKDFDSRKYSQAVYDSEAMQGGRP